MKNRSYTIFARERRTFAQLRFEGMKETGCSFGCHCATKDNRQKL